jgi:hypothetical protein
MDPYYDIDPGADVRARFPIDAEAFFVEEPSVYEPTQLGVSSPIGWRHEDTK